MTQDDMDRRNRYRAVKLEIGSHIIKKGDRVIYLDGYDDEWVARETGSTLKFVTACRVNEFGYLRRVAKASALEKLSDDVNGLRVEIKELARLMSVSMQRLLKENPRGNVIHFRHPARTEPAVEPSVEKQSTASGKKEK